MGKTKVVVKVKKNKDQRAITKKQVKKVVKSTSSTESHGKIKIQSNKIPTTTVHSTSTLSALQQKFAKKLEGSRFRTINEKLYTTTGVDSFREFQASPALFEVYHSGFREQATHWPENPLDGIIRWIKTRHQGAVVADMGCGDARLAKSISNKVHSFDFVAKDGIVVAADIAHVPLPDSSVDIVVFCLALMGTNLGDFIVEANRILKSGGILKIVEVRSRFEKDSDGIKKFMKVVKRAGFELVSDSNDLNKMFFMLECKKISCTDSSEKVEFSAKPCLYKRR